MTGASQAAAVVLIVEDDEHLREVVATALSDAGYTVLEVGTGEAAMTLLRSNQGEVDWLYTDIRLPGLVDGWRVADEFRFSHPARPVIYSSGYPAGDRNCVSCSRFLQKPFAPTELVNAFNELNSEQFQEPILFKLPASQT
jgi:two-component system, OmpR family, response regulator